MGSVQSPIITCRMHLSLLSLFLLSGWATSLPSTLIEPATTKMIHDMMDVIESGMEDPVEGQARAFWIGLTLTSTSTSLETATVTTTTTVRCIEGMFTECGDTTMVPETTPVATRKKKHGKHHQKKKGNKNKKNSSRKEDLLDIVDDVYRNAVVTDEDGVEKDVSVLMPELARSAEIDQLMEYYARDDVSSLQSGQLRWSEMEMEDQQRMGDMELEGSHCARNGIPHKRPRIFTIDNEVKTVTYTTTSTIIETAPATATFSVTLDTCTTAGFTFAVPLCTDLPTTTMPTVG